MVEPVKYPLQLENVYPALALAVPFTVSPCLTVNVALAPLLATALVPLVTAWAVTLPPVPLTTVIVYSLLLYQHPNDAFELTAVFVADAVNGDALVVLGVPDLYPSNELAPVGVVHIPLPFTFVPVFI